MTLYARPAPEDAAATHTEEIAQYMSSSTHTKRPNVHCRVNNENAPPNRAYKTKKTSGARRRGARTLASFKAAINTRKPETPKAIADGSRNSCEMVG